MVTTRSQSRLPAHATTATAAAKGDTRTRRNQAKTTASSSTPQPSKADTDNANANDDDDDDPKPPRKRTKPSTTSTTPTTKTRQSNKFPYHLPLSQLDLRAHPHLYRPGVGEQGVLQVRPYKDEILPHWTFKTPQRAQCSAEKIRGMFEVYLDQGDFVGCDMARKFIQMGYTRSRRYANHRGGRKYRDPADHSRGQLDRLAPPDQDPDKVESARIFRRYLDDILADERYTRLRQSFLDTHARVPVPHEDSDEIVRLRQDRDRIPFRHF
ncbi:uncharacterized protein PFL1_02450 [Pseudozyma flocculosa PF-1]|uniref:Uncharacterized protein n=2 Tax=Pseudozyma flocculosa TaxID=84751 RepID=A0A5C3EXU1_9BASI|nr:uncharacterized protein PFL1_02450 [Pseudozyma flocculosa PF-1]EPQ29777.1 hypothetical protein PFL1_02450 [Pseudozyma flocculosa PF-1]SPO37064.1 uncharacterized protein PSFLO_02536 [Pseudozyma flocculosa]